MWFAHKRKKPLKSKRFTGESLTHSRWWELQGAKNGVDILMKKYVPQIIKKVHYSKMENLLTACTRLISGGIIKIRLFGSCGEGGAVILQSATILHAVISLLTGEEGEIQGHISRQAASCKHTAECQDKQLISYKT